MSKRTKIRTKNAILVGISIIMLVVLMYSVAGLVAGAFTTASKIGVVGSIVWLGLFLFANRD